MNDAVRVPGAQPIPYRNQAARERTDQLFTVSETAQMLGLKEATVRVRIARRRLTFVKLGRSVRVPFSAIDDMVRNNTIPASR
jgi:excisionase family DNA binding protein